MSEQEIASLKARLAELSGNLHEVVDLSLDIVKRQPQQRAAISKLWEEFLGGFYQHVRKRSHETGLNLLGWLTFSRIARR